MTDTPKTTVFFDGSCPLCVREIALYRRLKPCEPVDWFDVSAVDPRINGIGLSQCDAMKRFHVQSPDGTLHSGAAAFARLWRMYPAFQLLGLLVSYPPLSWLGECAYRAFLLVRPFIQKLVKRITA